MERQGTIREYFGTLLGQKSYVKIYATSRENAVMNLLKVYGYNVAGGVYTPIEFEYQRAGLFKNYKQVGVLNQDLYLLSLRKRGII